MFSLESPHRGDSNEYTQYTVLNIKKKITQNYPKSAATGFCSKGLKNEFETAIVNEPSVFEPLKFNCIVINFCLFFFSPKSLYYDLSLELSCKNGSNDGKQHMFSLRNKNNYPVISPKRAACPLSRALIGSW